MEDKKKKSGSIETTTLERVPMGERKGWIDVALIQAGIMICVPSLLLGGILAEGMSLTNAILSGVVGYCIVVVLFVLMGIMGSDLGVPTCVTAIGGFGKKGARYIISTCLLYTSAKAIFMRRWNRYREIRLTYTICWRTSREC